MVREEEKAVRKLVLRVCDSWVRHIFTPLHPSSTAYVFHTQNILTVIYVLFLYMVTEKRYGSQHMEQEHVLKGPDTESAPYGKTSFEGRRLLIWRPNAPFHDGEIAILENW